MKEFKFKSFRCVEYTPARFKVYFSYQGEEMCIGYSKALLAPYYSDEKNEEAILGNSIRDYTDVIRKWEIAKKCVNK